MYTVPENIEYAYVSRYRIRYSMETMMNGYNTIPSKNNIFNENGHNFLDINYERDLNQDSLEPVMTKVNDWLLTQGVATEIRSTNIQYKKQNLSPMSEKVLNFEEIEDLI